MGMFAKMMRRLPMKGDSASKGMMAKAAKKNFFSGRKKKSEEAAPPADMMNRGSY